ncbi:hypothetical protein GCM10009756_00050 [Pseudokineococcus marinus]
MLQVRLARAQLQQALLGDRRRPVGAGGGRHEREDGVDLARREGRDEVDAVGGPGVEVRGVEMRGVEMRGVEVRGVEVRGLVGRGVAGRDGRLVAHGQPP